MNSRYDQTDAKVKYNLQFGIALYCKEQLIYDVSRCPFTLKINESTNRLSDKQYDGYVQYLSESERKVLNKFCGSLFLRYCTHDDLVDHFTQFLVDSEFEPNYFFHFCIDGPNMNLVVQVKLSKHLRDNLNTCSLHQVHTALHWEKTGIFFDVDHFFTTFTFSSSCQVLDRKISKVSTL